MRNKDQYFNAFKESNGRCNEIELGEKLGLNENTTRQILTQLLSEYKIEYVENGLCEYSVMKTVKGKIR
ncbi:hypothetical protein [Pedobacter foliorum]|uniref:hypothetical protein n=1 Tax=Pedobacter foliorum TaxID=2739058 RepID=UPI0015648BEF|nr:hypothetical protein [Pedobacter foliorum]NRF37506.1 hypothetical protein [Pedobacter foliorum]